MIPAGLRRQVGAGRVGHFATSDGRRPALVPVCFVLLEGALYHAIDDKPKSTRPGELRRVANIRVNPNAALLVDHYDEDWNRLWYVLLAGKARLIDSGVEHRRAIAALRRKYAQYRTTVPLAQDALVIALDVEHVTHWVSARGRRRGDPAMPPA